MTWPGYSTYDDDDDDDDQNKRIHIWRDDERQIYNTNECSSSSF